MRELDEGELRKLQVVLFRVDRGLHAAGVRVVEEEEVEHRHRTSWSMFSVQLDVLRVNGQHNGIERVRGEFEEVGAVCIPTFSGAF